MRSARALLFAAGLALGAACTSVIVMPISVPSPRAGRGECGAEQERIVTLERELAALKARREK